MREMLSALMGTNRSSAASFWDAGALKRRQGYRIWPINALLQGGLSDKRHWNVVFSYLMWRYRQKMWEGACSLPHGTKYISINGPPRMHKGHPKVAFAGEASVKREAYLTAQPVSSAKALPMSASERTVFTPASCSAANFSSAVPLPPEMIAPAWPMRLPAGAVTPAM